MDFGQKTLQRCTDNSLLHHGYSQDHQRLGPARRREGHVRKPMIGSVCQLIVTVRRLSEDLQKAVEDTTMGNDLWRDFESELQDAQKANKSGGSKRVQFASKQPVEDEKD